MLKAEFLFKIFRVNLAGEPISRTRERARQASYPMFCHNGIVYSTLSNDFLFNLSELID